MFQKFKTCSRYRQKDSFATYVNLKKYTKTLANIPSRVLSENNNSTGCTKRKSTELGFERLSSRVYSEDND